jgi:hypothetical protein
VGVEAAVAAAEQLEADHNGALIGYGGSLQQLCMLKRNRRRRNGGPEVLTVMKPPGRSRVWCSLISASIRA